MTDHLTPENVELVRSALGHCLGRTFNRYEVNKIIDAARTEGRESRPSGGEGERVATAYYDGFCDGIMRQPWEAAADYAAVMGQAYAKTGERPQPFLPVTGPGPDEQKPETWHMRFRALTQAGDYAAAIAMLRQPVAALSPSVGAETPAWRPDREAVARIVDHEGYWERLDSCNHALATVQMSDDSRRALTAVRDDELRATAESLGKADAILSLVPSQGTGEPLPAAPAQPHEGGDHG